MCGYFTKCQRCGQWLFYHEDCQKCETVYLGNIPQEILDEESQKGISPRLYQTIERSK